MGLQRRVHALDRELNELVRSAEQSLRSCRKAYRPCGPCRRGQHSPVTSEQALKHADLQEPPVGPVTAPGLVAAVTRQSNFHVLASEPADHISGDGRRIGIRLVEVRQQLDQSVRELFGSDFDDVMLEVVTGC